MTLKINLARYFNPENRNYQPITQESGNQSGGNQATRSQVATISGGNQETTSTTRNAADIRQNIWAGGMQVVEEGFNRPPQENSPPVNLPSQEGDDLR